jgi:hypothetical protein
MINSDKPDPVFKKFVKKCPRKKGYQPVGWRQRIKVHYVTKLSVATLAHDYSLSVNSENIRLIFHILL